MDEKIPVVYILSTGRSGTTLLDMLLGAHSRMWTLGEAINLVWDLQEDHRAPCGCGEPVASCPFWEDLVDQIPIDPSGYHIGYFHDQDQTGKVLQWPLLPDILSGEIREEWRPAVREHGQKNARYFRAVKQAVRERSESEIDWLVDNSKNLYRLFWLQQSNHFNIRVVHLMKDPPAFVYSMMKKNLPYTGRKIMRFTARWVIQNALMRHVCKTCFSRSEVYPVSYETLAAQPGPSMKALGQWLGLEYSPTRVHNFRDYENHALSGNFMRWRDSEDEIRLDESWKRNLPSHYAAFVRLVTKPFERICGYKDAM